MPSNAESHVIAPVSVGHASKMVFSTPACASHDWSGATRSTFGRSSLHMMDGSNTVVVGVVVNVVVAVEERVVVAVEEGVVVTPMALKAVVQEDTQKN